MYSHGRDRIVGPTPNFFGARQTRESNVQSPKLGTRAWEGKQAQTFYVVRLAFDGNGVPAEHLPRLKGLMSRVVETLQDTIGIIDFWKKPIEVKKLRGNIDTEILLTGIPQLTERHERIAVEIVKLAEKRHNQLTR